MPIAAQPLTTSSRLALVTGATGGLGTAVCRRLASDGLRVVVADVDGQAARSVAATLHGEGHLGLEMNVASEDSVVAGFERVERELGPLDILCTFAGVLGNDAEGNQPALAELTLDLWNATFAVNATGTFLCIREYARHRLARPVRNGRIVTVSSSGAQLGGYQAKSAYCASKGAVLSLTKAVARELAGSKITVNCICPGPIDTPMLSRARGAKAPPEGEYDAMAHLPLGRIGTPGEIAAAAAYLISVEAGFVTGSTLDVNGGLRMQ